MSIKINVKLQSRFNYDVFIHIIAEQINGEAFKDLSREDLKDMGFKMGPCKIILKIIEDLNK